MVLWMTQCNMPSSALYISAVLDAHSTGGLRKVMGASPAIPQLQQVNSPFPHSIAVLSGRHHSPMLALHLKASAHQSRWKFSSVCIDFWPAEVSDGKPMDVLVVTDHFSKMAQAFPCKNQSAKQVARRLWNDLFLVYGYPK